MISTPPWTRRWTRAAEHGDDDGALDAGPGPAAVTTQGGARRVKVDALPDFAALGESAGTPCSTAPGCPSVSHLAVADRWSRAFAATAPQQICDRDGSRRAWSACCRSRGRAGRQRIIGGIDVSDYLDLIAVAAGRGGVAGAARSTAPASPASGTCTASAPPRPPPPSCPRWRRPSGCRPRWSGRTAARCWRCPRPGTSTWASSPARTGTSSAARCAASSGSCPGRRCARTGTRRAGTRP